MPGISPENKPILESDRLQAAFEAAKASEKNTAVEDEKAKAYRQARRIEIERAESLQSAQDKQEIDKIKKNIEEIPGLTMGSSHEGVEETQDDIPTIIGTEVEKPAA